ncbi:hypothetical protein BJ508DRAFT_332262 [Ascobolus immersus RN42]|uniref:Uncharacterized protein n=1 Tax=Ascobolus immersus RN42 TaxID=1160509 RepID=A0A3N4HPR1_ASCIM|nr:hypothetical protein BJ508DRAFT_332262 [Ascobolus immersus RN42]
MSSASNSAPRLCPTCFTPNPTFHHLPFHCAELNHIDLHIGRSPRGPTWSGTIHFGWYPRRMHVPAPGIPVRVERSRDGQFYCPVRCCEYSSSEKEGFVGHSLTHVDVVSLMELRDLEVEEVGDEGMRWAGGRFSRERKVLGRGVWRVRRKYRKDIAAPMKDVALRLPVLSSGDDRMAEVSSEEEDTEVTELATLRNMAAKKVLEITMEAMGNPHTNEAATAEKIEEILRLHTAGAKALRMIHK